MNIKKQCQECNKYVDYVIPVTKIKDKESKLINVCVPCQNKLMIRGEIR